MNFDFDDQREDRELMKSTVLCLSFFLSFL